MNSDEILQKLDDFLILGPDETISDENMFNYMAIRQGVMIHIKENQDVAFKQYIDKVYSDFHINELLVSRKFFLDFMMDEYISFRSNKKTCDILSDVKAIDVEEMHVLLPIYFVQIINDNINIENIPFIKYQSIDKYLKTIGMSVPKDIDDIKKDKTFGHIPFVDIVIKAREKDYATEQAKLKLEEIVHVLNFILYSHIRGIETISATTDYGTIDRQFIFTKDTSSMSTKVHPSAVKRITIDDIEEYLNSDGKVYKELINILNKKEKNEIETRIVNAVNWAGMAVSEKNNSVAFTQAIFAIESLLQQQIKGEIFNKSIVASISEDIAFLLGKNFDERKKYEKDFKELYSVRSSIAHGKSSQINPYQVLSAIAMAKLLIQELILNPALKGAVTMQKITNYITKQKYTVINDKETE